MTNNNDPPIDTTLAKVLLQRLGVRLTKHRDGTFTGNFGNCRYVDQMFQCKIEKKSLRDILLHAWEGNGAILNEQAEPGTVSFGDWIKALVAEMDALANGEGWGSDDKLSTAPPAEPLPERPLHPLCELFPAIEGAAFDKLVASIRENGLQEPITVIGDDEAILDGRNRYRACLAASVDPVFRPFTGEDPVRFVIAANLTRRHLTDSQRAMLAARLATREIGSNQHHKEGASIDAPSQAKAAELLSVSRSSVQRAREVLERAEPADVVAITKGEATVSGIAKKLKAAEEKKQRRAARESELAAKQHALPKKKYGVILADPEWRFEPYSRETGMDRAADNHYPTSTTDAIGRRAVWSIAADDCVLFLWATVPMLPAALEVMKGWGFEYKSHAIWDKVHIGTGYWFRNRHELLLVGTKGSIPAPAMGDQFPSLAAVARKEHSAKPDQFIEMIESYFPTLPKIELNRRGPARAGWDAWGNEVAASDEESVPADEPELVKAPTPPPSPSSNNDGLDIPAQFRRPKIPTETQANK